MKDMLVGEDFVPGLQWGHVFSDVEIPMDVNASDKVSCFNGATSFQTWKFAQHVNAGAQVRSFNGATSFQTWKLAQETTKQTATAELQWGHVFSDVEMIDILGLATLTILASMGPRLFRRGNST